jgi:hypothetical protein
MLCSSSFFCAVHASLHGVWEGEAYRSPVELRVWTALKTVTKITEWLKSCALEKPELIL